MIKVNAIKCKELRLSTFPKFSYYDLFPQEDNGLGTKLHFSCLGETLAFCCKINGSLGNH